jgi:hypothetical protein
MIDHIGVGLRQGADRHVEPFFQRIDRAVDQHDLHLHPRIGSLESGADIAEEHRGQRRRRLDAQRTGQPQLMSVGGRQRFLDLADQELQAGPQPLAVERQGQSSCRAYEKLGIEVLFEPLDALGDDRRRDAQITAGSGKTAGAGSRQERTDIEKYVHCLSRFEKKSEPVSRAYFPGFRNSRRVP